MRAWPVGVAVGVAFAAFAAGCGGSSNRTTATGQTRSTQSLFAYDRSAPLGFRDSGRVNRRTPIAVHDVSYESPKGGRVPGYLIVPPGRGRHPAVIYMHGRGGNRLDFVVPGSWMAARGAVALTIEAPFERAHVQLLRGKAGARRERDLTVQNVVELRRAVDLLQSLPQVDPKRIAYVGLSAGAHVGAILAGVEHRIKAFDLLSGGAFPVSAFANAAAPSDRLEITRVLKEIDALRYVRRAAPSALLFQDGLRDQVVPRAALLALSQAGSRPKEVRWYAAGHGLDTRAYRDQLRWLSRRLGLDGPVVRGALAGP